MILCRVVVKGFLCLVILILDVFVVFNNSVLEVEVLLFMVIVLNVIFVSFDRICCSKLCFILVLVKMYINIVVIFGVIMLDFLVMFVIFMGLLLIIIVVFVFLV